MSHSSALPATTPSDTWFGCFTGDCPHGTRAECDAAIRAEFAHLARENARVHWLLVRAESGLENWGRHHPWCVTSQRSPCNCGYQTLLDDLSTGVSPSEGSATDTPTWREAASAPQTGEHILVTKLGRAGFGYCGVRNAQQDWCAVVHYWPVEDEEGFYLSSGASATVDDYPVHFSHWMPLP